MQWFSLVQFIDGELEYLNNYSVEALVRVALFHKAHKTLKFTCSIVDYYYMYGFKLPRI